MTAGVKSRCNVSILKYKWECVGNDTHLQKDRSVEKSAFTSKHTEEEKLERLVTNPYSHLQTAFTFISQYSEPVASL